MQHRGIGAPRGFTLIELMVTIAIIAIMMMIAAPSFSSFQRSSDLSASANAFLSTMAATRAEAMKRGVKAYIVPIDPDNNWAKGWRAFADTNWDGVYTAADVLISEQEALPSTVTVTTATDVDGFARGSSFYVAFNGSGYPTLKSTDTGTPSGAIQFSISGSDKRVVLNPVGRMRVCKASDTSCTPSGF